MFCRVTTRRRKLWLLAGLGCGLDARPARPFGLGVLGFDLRSLTSFGLPSRRLPATDLSPTLGILTVALIPGPRLILASTPFAQAGSLARPARSGRTTTRFRNVVGAQGRVVSRGKARGERCCVLLERYQNRNQTDALV